MAKTQYIEFGSWLRDHRVEKGLTQLAVARTLGYANAQFVSNAERGLCRLPFEAISRLVKMYNLDPEVLIERLLGQHEDYYREVFKKSLAGKKKRSK